MNQGSAAPVMGSGGGAGSGDTGGAGLMVARGRLRAWSQGTRSGAGQTQGTGA